MTFQDAIRFLDSFVNYEKISSYNYRESLKLERMKHLLELIGNPQKGLKVLHIAGTKGKGSTAAVLSSILHEAGFKVGLYTSPHLISFNERIKIDNIDISDDAISEIVSFLEPFCNNMRSESNPPSFFEIYTALTFLYFQKNKTDFTVLETGLGGRLDATNTAESFVSGITPISYEHMDKLGITLREIAFEKSGIIKNNSFVVSSLQEEEALFVIENESKKRNSRLFLIGRDIIYKKGSFNSKIQRFDVKGIFREYKNLETRLLGDHQLNNIATAIGMAEILRFYDVIIKPEAIREGVSKVFWPGRLEVLRENPTIVLDGAQNKASAKALKESIKKYFNYNKVILILGVSKDKDIKGISEELLEISHKIILTKANLQRAMDTEVMSYYFKDKDTVLTKNVDDAVNKAIQGANKNDLILITGSLFVVGEAKKILN